MAPPAGGWDRGTAAPAGMPLAGIPPELLEQIATLEADEPDHLPPDGGLSDSDNGHDHRPLTLRRFLAPFRWALLGALALMVVETVAMRIGPLLTQLAIDRGMGLQDLGDGPVRGSAGFLVGIFAVFLGSVVVAVVAARLRTLWTGKVGERLLYALRLRVFSHLQRLSLDFYSRHKTGVLFSRMTSDIDNLQALFHEGLVQLAVQALTLTILAVQLFVFSPRLAAITLFGITPVMLALTVWFHHASNRGYVTVRDRLADVLADLSETLAGIREVSAHNRQQHNSIHHANIAGRYLHANNYTARIAGIYSPASEAVGNLTLIVVLGLGGRMVLAGQMQVGELAGFLLALTTFFAPMQQLAQLFNVYQQGQSGIVKLRQLLLEQPSVIEKPDAYHLPPIHGRVTLDGVTFGYDPTHPVLHDLQLDIQPGQTCAVVGATGAGKSTIAKLIPRFYDPDRGRVLIDGHNLRDVQVGSLRRQLGIVPQEPFLFSGTIRDNIGFARPDATDDHILQAAHAVGLGDLLARLPAGIHTPIHERGASLSAGERQLLALARVFLARPRIIVLDEATSSLDLHSEHDVERALDVLLAGRTAIIIAHRLTTAMRADTIAVIDHGRIAELGNHDQLVARGGLYADMHATWQHDTA